jgi:hypothetical protein
MLQNSVSALLLIWIVYKYSNKSKKIVKSNYYWKVGTKYNLEVGLFVTFKMAYDYIVYIFWSDF